MTYNIVFDPIKDIKKTIKLCWHSKINHIFMGKDFTTHAELIRNKLKGKVRYDDFVRAIYFKDKNVLYFRYYDPLGEYEYTDVKAEQNSFQQCDKALDVFIKEKIMPKNVRILYWQLGYGITAQDTAL